MKDVTVTTHSTLVRPNPKYAAAGNKNIYGKLPMRLQNMVICETLETATGLYLLRKKNVRKIIFRSDPW